MPVPRSEQRCRCSQSNAFFATERLSLEERATRSVGIGADLARLDGGVGGEAALGDGHAHLGSIYRECSRSQSKEYMFSFEVILTNQDVFLKHANS